MGAPTKKRPAVEKEEPSVQRGRDYYLAPTEDGQPMKPQKSQSTSLDVSKHAYENNTLKGKANIVYEVGFVRERDSVVSNKETGARNQIE